MLVIFLNVLLILHLICTLHSYPLGLNKRERREFEKRNSELFEKKIAAEAKVREAAAAAAAEAAAEAAIGQEEGDQGTETTGAGETDNGGNVPEEEAEDDDGWISQFTPGPSIIKWGN